MDDAALERSSEQMMEAINKNAQRVLAVGPDARKPIYDAIEDAYRKAAMDIGRTPEQATGMGRQMREFVAALVKIIEDSGGATGGNA